MIVWYLFQGEILMMRQFDFPHVLPLHTAFVSNLDVFVVSPVMCYNSCRDAMNTYFSTGEHLAIDLCHSFHWLSGNGHSGFRISRDFSLPHFTWCTAWYRLLAWERFHPSFHTCQSHSDQSVEGRSVRFSWNISTDHARSTDPSAVRFTAAQHKESELVGARGAGTEFVRLQREIGCL